jgi:hypothetical protein
MGKSRRKTHFVPFPRAQEKEQANEQMNEQSQHQQKELVDEEDEDPCLGCDQPESQCMCHQKHESDPYDPHGDYEEDEGLEVKEQCPKCKRWGGKCRCSDGVDDPKVHAIFVGWTSEQITTIDLDWMIAYFAIALDCCDCRIIQPIWKSRPTSTLKVRHYIPDLFDRERY